MMSSNMKFFIRPALNAMKYASGKAITRSITVAAPANSSERVNCVWYAEIASEYVEKCHENEDPVSGLPDCSETLSWLRSGTRKKMTSHSSPGPRNRYGSSC